MAKPLFLKEGLMTYPASPVLFFRSRLVNPAVPIIFPVCFSSRAKSKYLPSE